MKTKRKPLTKLQLSARGQPCTVRIFGVCNHNPETTVLAHLNGGGGGMKHPDLFACFACFDCHEWLDGGYTRTDATRKDRDMAHYQAIHRTQKWWLENGYILIR